MTVRSVSCAVSRPQRRRYIAWEKPIFRSVFIPISLRKNLSSAGGSPGANGSEEKPSIKHEEVRLSAVTTKGLHSPAGVEAADCCPKRRKNSQANPVNP